jgi:hypothetical protein
MAHVPAWLGIGCLFLMIGFVGFAFRQGMKVKRPDDGGGSGDHGHLPESTGPT